MIEVFDPIAPLAHGEAHLAPRVSSLVGKSVAILTTEGPNGRELLEAIAKLLVARDGVRAVYHRSRQGGGDYDLVGGQRTPSAPAQAAALADRIDAAITGVGL